VVARLDQVLRELPPATPPDAAMKAIEGVVDGFAGFAGLLDDQTLLAVRDSEDRDV
jgi:hypothetical protein